MPGKWNKRTKSLLRDEDIAGLILTRAQQYKQQYSATIPSDELFHSTKRFVSWDRFEKILLELESSGRLFWDGKGYLVMGTSLPVL